jgi:inorganic triphosphatase YgiF
MSANGPSHHLEVERKFDVDASIQPPSFDGLEGVARVERVQVQSLDAVYFDTVERDLAANRITLRRRTGGLDAGWHLKLPAGSDARTEMRVPLDDDASHQVPTELLDLVLAIVRDYPVTPVARISTTRQVQLLRGADDAVIAEFCDDQVTAGLGADGSAAEQRWREWELELVGDSANAELMDRVCDRLLDAGAKPAGHGSKLARVLDTPSERS